MWRGVANGSSLGQMRRTISIPGSWPVDCTTTSRPLGASARAIGASTIFTFGSAGVRERYGWAASTRSYLKSWAAPMLRGIRSCEREGAVAAVQHEHRRLGVHGVAGLRARDRLPSLGEHVLELTDLLLELVRGRALETDVPPAAPGPAPRGCAGTARVPRRRTCW